MGRGPALRNRLKPVTTNEAVYERGGHCELEFEPTDMQPETKGDAVMRTLITKVLAGGIVLACLLTAMPESAEAQRRGHDRDRDRDWHSRYDHDGYWNSHWNWYDGRYRTYYHRRTPRYQHYDDRSYRQPYYGRRGHYRDRDGGSVRVGPLHLRWR